MSRTFRRNNPRAYYPRGFSMPFNRPAPPPRGDSLPLHKRHTARDGHAWYSCCCPDYCVMGWKHRNLRAAYPVDDEELTSAMKTAANAPHRRLQFGSWYT